MDITRVVLDMIRTRVNKKFELADSIVADFNKKRDNERAAINKWVRDIGVKFAKEAEEKFEKSVKAKYPNATFDDKNWSVAKCFNFDKDYVHLNADCERRSTDSCKADVIEACKQIAIENGAKTAFREIDKYLDGIDPVEILKLK